MTVPCTSLEHIDMSHSKSTVNLTTGVTYVVPNIKLDEQRVWITSMGANGTFPHFIECFGYEDQQIAESDYEFLLEDTATSALIRRALTWSFIRFKANFSSEYWITRRLRRQERQTKAIRRTCVLNVQARQDLAGATADDQ